MESLFLPSLRPSFASTNVYVAYHRHQNALFFVSFFLMPKIRIIPKSNLCVYILTQFMDK